jgi:hypothetical protein
VSDLSQERREECRAETLRFLVARQVVAHHPQTIRRGLNVGHRNDFEDADVEASLVFLVDANFVKIVRQPLGATKFYQATSQGVLASERADPLV